MKLTQPEIDRLISQLRNGLYTYLSKIDYGPEFGTGWNDSEEEDEGGSYG